MEPGIRQNSEAEGQYKIFGYTIKELREMEPKHAAHTLLCKGKGPSEIGRENIPVDLLYRALSNIFPHLSQTEISDVVDYAVSVRDGLILEEK